MLEFIRIGDEMKREAPVKKNEEYIIDINGMGYEGEGVGKIDNFTVFVPGALKGEKVKVLIVKVNKNFGFGKLKEVIEPSKDRVAPACEIYEKCGGCQLQHLSYKGQLEFKKSRVQDCIERIGGFDLSEDNIQLHETLGMENPYRYRNKVQLPVGGTVEDVKIGFYSQRSHNIIDMESCNIQFEEADTVVDIVKQWMQENKIQPYNEETHTGIVKHIMVRKAFNNDELMVVVVTNGKSLPKKEILIKELQDSFNNLVSVVQNVNDKKTNVVLGLDNVTLFGKDTISDYIGEFKFNISPLSFFQVNPVQTEVLYNKALEYAGLTGNEVVFDAYCGTGTISLFLSKKASKVYGVEIIEAAIENANINAKENKIDNAEFFVGKCEDVIPKLIADGVKADVVVVDPPRKGCEKSLLDALVSMSPERIVYVSCDPGTLARDLRILCDMGYDLKEVQPVDMFPETGHVESVVLITRKDR
ncbi:RNA methyltransferase, TrmA family [Clostridium cellulovorans 743B]|uniref:RNA methyltransferase, TrmA family n=2 Tax=Clostridium cellulovorans TaxID=1493 RepID=D9SQA8_CLOC7|nr:23S rRNA (uracil(1939)-C(5))-methyltransferase RlmD [Clostridium cellulovorans]ADL50175.1 RNA methyltransferase, TrmA family [Clostridium cellulovorans 743B]